ncbi:MAG: DUF4129 domain-containing protein [Gemmatimonadales bacterium]|nr:DUF4129 domain-containing protein [Gemmatimonadales bacterium]
MRGTVQAGQGRSLRSRAVAGAGAALLLLGAAAALLPEGISLLKGRGSGTFALRLSPSLLRGMLVPMLILGLLAAIAGFVMAGRTLIERPRASWGLRGASVFLAVGLIGAIYLLVRAFGDGDGPGVSAPADSTAPSPEPEAVGPGASTALPLFLVGGLVLLVAAGVGTLVLVRRGRDAEQADASGGGDLWHEVDAGINALSAIPDPRAAVLACYARMQRVVDAAGIARSPSDTPLETLENVLRERRVPAASARELTRLFEWARFSPHEIDEAMRREATAALIRVREGLRPPPQTPAEQGLEPALERR